MTKGELLELIKDLPDDKELVAYMILNACDTPFGEIPITDAFLIEGDDRLYLKISDL